jgi:hypothetical protein
MRNLIHNMRKKRYNKRDIHRKIVHLYNMYLPYDAYRRGTQLVESAFEGGEITFVSYVSLHSLNMMLRTRGSY